MPEAAQAAPLPPLQEPDSSTDQNETAAPEPPSAEIMESPGPAGRTCCRRPPNVEEEASVPDVAVTLPLHPFGLMIDNGEGGEMPILQYWPFSTTDLYNWKNNNSSFSENPTKLTNLVDSVMFSHQPTWDDCTSCWAPCSPLRNGIKFCSRPESMSRD